MGFADRQVAEIAASLPGATQGVPRAQDRLLLRRPGAAGAGGGRARRAACPRSSASWRSSTPADASGAAGDRGADRHILTPLLTTTHRRELPELVRSRGQGRGAPRRAPGGAARRCDVALEEAAEALDAHMQKEEQALFPLMRAGGHPMIHVPIGMMRGEHDEHGERLAQLEALTHDCVPPPEACASWRGLYAGVRKLVDDVREHVRLENNAPFPRYGA
ncbi:MAG: hemerythrin domain-containing protein [Rhodopseudomonas palustris]|nr:hemerythrin domain-containing protein [Rhodopseudomonas palustris]